MRPIGWWWKSLSARSSTALDLVWRAVAWLLLFAPAHADELVLPTASLGIAQLIELAEAHYPSVKAAQSGADAAQAGVRAARAQYYPTPSVQVQQDNQGDTVSVLALSQPLWAGGRLDAGFAVAESRAEAADQAISEVQHELALRVIDTWGRWLQARGRTASLESGVRLLDVYADSVSRRIAGGAAGKVDRELVTSRLAQTDGDLLAARAAERTARAGLSQLVGRPLRGEELLYPATNTSLATGLGLPLASLSRVTEQAIERSPALHRRQADVEAAEAEISQRRATLLPTLNLRAQHQRNDTSITAHTGTDNRIMLVFEYVPGAGLSASAETDAAVARASTKRNELQTARSDLIETVTADYEDAIGSAQRLDQLRRSLAASSAVLASYDRLFIAGKRSWLDVLNTAQEVIRLRTALADVQAQLAAARRRLRLHAGEVL